MKWTAMAPIWLKIGVPYIVFREESEYDIPGAQFHEETTKNENMFSGSKDFKNSQNSKNFKWL